MSARRRPQGEPSDTLGHVLLAVFGVVAAGTLYLLAASRWNTGLSTNYDLGIFAQSAQSYAHGHWPTSDIRQLPLLGDHFSPILALNGIAWRVWPDPRVLLLTQSIALALTAWMLGLTARARLGIRGAVALMLVLLTSVGVLAADLFDFHETAYAAPLVALACRGLIRRSWGVVLASSVVLLLVKEDLGLTVMGVAACWLVRSRWRGWARAVGLVVLAVVGIVVAVIVIARVNPTGGSDYLSMFGIGEKKHVTGAQTGALLDARRLLPFAAYTLATLVVGWRSPLTLVALPTLLWRAASSNPLYWTPQFHYDLIPAVVGAFAALDVLARRREPASDADAAGSRAWAPLPRSLVALMVAAALANTAWGAAEASSRLSHGIALREDASLGHLRDLAARVPRDAPVATLNDIGAYLVATHRHVHTLQLDHPEPVRYVLFSDNPAWQTRYPQALRRRLVEEASARQGKHVWTSGPYTLVDLGGLHQVPGTSAP